MVSMIIIIICLLVWGTLSGDDTPLIYQTPIAVQTVPSIIHVAAGRNHFLMLAGTGTNIYAFGYNDFKVLFLSYSHQ